jgi:hypothetical protein
MLSKNAPVTTGCGKPLRVSRDQSGGNPLTTVS